MRTSLAIALLLASTALTQPAWSQTAPSATPDAAASTNSAGGFGATQPTDIGKVTARGQATPDGNTRVDIGGGLMIQEDQPKGRSTVTRDFISKQSPTSNPYQLISLLPGANVTSPDAFGLNGGNITIRGFNSDQMGLTIDGAPVNDSGNYALYPQEYLDAQNIGQISIAQGAADLDSPHIGATGGVINIYSKDPLKEAGGFAAFSYGSNHTTNEFVRLETGQIGRFRGYVSYSKFDDDHWRGPGGDHRYNVDGKFVVDVGESSKITGAIVWNEERNNFYNAPTLAGFNQYGYSAAQNNYPSVFTSQPTVGAGGVLTQATTNYYRTRINPFQNMIASLPSTFALTDDLTLDVTPYFWYGFGNGGGTSQINEAKINYGDYSFSQDLNGNGTVKDKLLYYTPSITQTYRPGVISKLTYQFDNHKIVAGYWYEAAFHKQYGDAERLNADGSVLDVYGQTNNVIIASGPYAGQVLQKRDTITNTRTNVLFVGDSVSLMDDRLNIEYGVKQAFVSRHGQNLLPTLHPFVNLEDSETLPTAGASFKLDEFNTLFADITTSFRTPQNYALYDTYSLTSSAANNGYQPAAALKPERTTGIEIGHRYQSDVINTSLTAFAYHFQSRQIQTNIPDPAGGTGIINVDINAGNTTTYGVDFEIGTRPISNFRPYFSLEFLHARMDGNIQATGTNNANDYLPTKGKYVPQSPDMQAALGVDYDDGHILGNFNIKYTGRQFSTFTNDESIPGFARANAMIGYRFEDYGRIKAPQIKLNLYNIADQTGLVGVNGVTSTSSSIKGVRGNTIAGSAPTYYVGQGFAALITLSSAF